MKKNLLIAFESIVILALIYLLLARPHVVDHTKAISAPQVQQLTKQSKTIHFPDIQLRENERIIAAKMFFQNASVRTIRNIPPSWYASIDLNPPPNPSFDGHIEVGAAALSSTQELPEFEVDSYLSEMEPRAQKAVVTVTEYPGDGKERNIEVELSKPNQQAKHDRR